MSVITTLRFSWGPLDGIRRRFASWVDRHPILWALLGGVRWLLLHPAWLAGGVLAVWTWMRWHSIVLAVTAVIFPAVFQALATILWLGSRAQRGARLTVAQIVAGMGRRRKLLRRWSKAAKAAGILDRDGDHAPPPLSQVRITADGLTATVLTGVVGRKADDVARGADDIAATIPGCRKVSVVQGSTPGVARAAFQWADPLARTLRLTDLPMSPGGRLAYGLTEDGHPATVAKFKSLLVVGLSGSGKSGILWALLAAALADGTPIRLRVIDPAGGVELHALKGSPLVREYADRPSAAADLVKHAHTAMNNRLEAMSGRARMHRPTEAEPWDITVIDELLLLQHMLVKGAQSPLGEILAVGRKAAYSVWALSQVGQVDTIGRARNLFVQRICLATDSRAMTDAVLGDGAESLGARCSRIPESLPGMGYAVTDDVRGFRRVRSVWLPDDEVGLIGRGRVPAALQDQAAVAAERKLEFRRTALYRWFDVDGRLLYVGISDAPLRRTGEHEDGQPWWGEIASNTVDWYPNRFEALKAEEQAIKMENPLHNVVHNRRRLNLSRGRS